MFQQCGLEAIFQLLNRSMDDDFSAKARFGFFVSLPAFSILRIQYN